MNDAEPSLILARQEHAYGQSHHNHLQLHQKLHKRQAVIEIELAEASATTEVHQTIPVARQVDVNSDGSTFAVQTLPASDYSFSNTRSATTTPTDLPMTASRTAITSAVSSDAGVQATSTGQVTLSPSAEPDATSTSAPSAGFSTLTPNANSTKLISSTNPVSTRVSASISGSISGSISSSTILFSNATTSSTSSSRANSTTLSFTDSTFASTITSSFSSSSSSISSAASSTSFVSSSTPLSLASSSPSSPSQTDSTDGGAHVGGGVGTSSVPGSSATSTPILGGSRSSNGTVVSSTPSTSKIVGGVVGGVAGLAALLFLLMFVLRWKKKNGGMVSLASVAPSTIAGGGNGGGVGGNNGSGAAADPRDFSNQSPRSMTERRSLAMAVPAALANLSKYKRTSQNTVTNTVSSAGSERGFYRVSGKKLPSVLQHGGDGFGGPNQNTMSGSTFYSSGAPAFPNPNTLSGASFYRDSQGFYGGEPSPPLDPPNRDSGVPVMRPSPARTPVTEHGPFAAPPGPISPRPDILGRSHPSQDGSHASRFTEEV